MRPRVNGINEALAKRQAAMGMAVQLSCPEMAEVAGAVGYDFVYIDCEHGSFFIETAVQIIRAAEAAGTTPIVRVPNHDPTVIARALDAGAMGVIVPNVSTQEQARSAAAAAKFKMNGDHGARGACPGTRATWHQTSNWGDFVTWSNANTLLWVLIESPEGASNIEEIMSVPGVDAVMLGQFDLAHALGIPGQTRHPEVTRIYDDLIKKARARGMEVVASLFSSDPAEMRIEKQHWLEMGARILVAGSDRRMIVGAMRDRLTALRS